VGLFAIGAGPGGGPEVRVLNPNGTIRYSFFALEPNFTGGVVVATGDITGDGVDDIVTAAGPGGGSHVKVFDGATATQIGNFFAFDPSFTGGVSLALGDVNGDGHADLIIGAGPGGAPHVRVFDGALLTSTSPGVPPAELASFFAYDRRFRGGVHVAAGDIDGDGVDEIITGAGADGGPHVQVFDGRTLAIRQSFFAYEPTFTGGVTVAAGDLDGDGRAEIITGTGAGGGPLVSVFRASDAAPLNSFFAYDPSFLGGVTVAFDVQPDATPVLLTGPGVGGGPVINGYTGVEANLLYDFFAFDPAFRGGAYVG
jgi:hypothetical protein